MTTWNFADVWEAVAAVRGDAPALIQGTRRYTWADFDRRADAVAGGLLGFGVTHQATVAQYLYNSPEYLESVFAAWKVGLVPVNTNYRYADDELVSLWRNADISVVVFHGAFAERINRIRHRVPAVRGWIWVDDGTGPCPGWAEPYEALAARPATGRPTRAPWGRSPDDLYLLYTGGTTGLPKGVMWRQDDLFALLNRTAEVRYPEEGGVGSVPEALRRSPHLPARSIPCPPLMHGSGAFTTFSVLDSGGCIVLLASRHFSAVELLDTVQRERATQLTIVGDAFARPLLAELDAHPGRWDISSLWLIVSSGVMWSEEIKAGLLRHQPRLLCVDSLGSSEAIGIASSRSSSRSTAATAGFTLGPDAKVITDDGRDVVAGSGQLGLVALRGRAPVGYYRDEAKTAATFRVIDGVRWSVPGDWALVNADGTVRLLGRGSQCINTGGEKVFPEEVEEALKTYPAVLDAVAVGVPDARFGEAVVALVEVSGPIDEGAVIDHVKGRLASFKAPRHVVVVPTIGRDTNGKVDYRRLKAELAERAARP